MTLSEFKCQHSLKILIFIDKRNVGTRLICYIICCNSVYIPICSVTHISATVTPIGVKFCTMVDMGSEHKIFHLGVPQRALKSQILIANISKTVSRSVTCHWLDESFPKCLTRDGIHMGVPYKENIFFCPGTYLAPISVKICMMVQLRSICGFLHFWWRYL